MDNQSSFIERYLDFYTGTEPPTIYNRWCAIAGIGALLGRTAWIQHGHTKIYPNQYIMLVGEAGCRKSTAIKVFLKPFLVGVGYSKIAASKTSKEKFLADLEEGMEKATNPEEHLNVTKNVDKWGRDKNSTMRELFGVINATEPSECLIMADEFNVFMGHSNVEFIDMLTDLWDYDGVYASRTKSGKSVLVPNPTISGLLGNTQVGISMSFPTEVIGQGFFSRIILVHSDPSGRKIAFPEAADPIRKKALLEQLTRIKGNITGEITIHPIAKKALGEIYSSWQHLSDVRFKSYSTRRFTHLLKVCLCCAASKESKIIELDTVIYANSILHYTEHTMPKALGEFGKARNSDVVAKVLLIIDKAIDTGIGLHPMDDIWPQVSRDLESPQQLVQILSGLAAAGKLQQVDGKLFPAKEVKRFDQPYTKVALLREYLEDQQKDGTIP